MRSFLIAFSPNFNFEDEEEQTPFFERNDIEHNPNWHQRKCQTPVQILPSLKKHSFPQIKKEHFSLENQ